MLHKNITTSDMHYIQAWSVADTTARDALSVAAADVGKVCQVTGTNAYYILTDDSPMTWQLFGAGTVSTLDASVADVLSISGTTLSADDPGADRLVFWDDSASKWVYLTAGSGLTITDTTITSSGGGITLDTPVTLTTQTSVDFTIPAGAKSISLMFSGASSNGTSAFLIQLGDAGGVETTGYAAGASRISTTVTTQNSSAGFVLVGGSVAAGTDYDGRFTLTLLDSTNNVWAMSGFISDQVNTQTHVSGGTKALSQTLSTVRFTTVNGTDQFDAGTVNVSYSS